jgi:hypothetical protein
MRAASFKAADFQRPGQQAVVDLQVCWYFYTILHTILASCIPARCCQPVRQIERLNSTLFRPLKEINEVENRPLPLALSQR